MLFTTRRTFLANLAVLAALPGCSAMPGAHRGRPHPILHRAEALRGGRIGVYAQDLETGTIISHRGEERFAMCSTFKWILCGLLLARVERGEERLSRPLPIAEVAIVPHSPVTQSLIGSALSIERLCHAAITVSDNTAANLLLETVGGPAGFTASLRRLGDEITRLDRYETALNAAATGDPRDTTTPAAMAALMRGFIFGDFLAPGSQTLLRQWMHATKNGEARLKAGVGPEWSVGHKPGTNNTNINNDVGFFQSITHPRRAPVLIASFSDAPRPVGETADATHAMIAAAVLEAFSATRTTDRNEVMQ